MPCQTPSPGYSGRQVDLPLPSNSKQDTSQLGYLFNLPTSHGQRTSLWGKKHKLPALLGIGLHAKAARKKNAQGVNAFALGATGLGLHGKSQRQGHVVRAPTTSVTMFVYQLCCFVLLSTSKSPPRLPVPSLLHPTLHGGLCSRLPVPLT